MLIFGGVGGVTGTISLLTFSVEDVDTGVVSFHFSNFREIWFVRY